MRVDVRITLRDGDEAGAVLSENGVPVDGWDQRPSQIDGYVDVSASLTIPKGMDPDIGQDVLLANGVDVWSWEVVA